MPPSVAHTSIARTGVDTVVAVVDLVDVLGFAPAIHLHHATQSLDLLGDFSSRSNGYSHRVHIFLVRAYMVQRCSALQGCLVLKKRLLH